MGGELAFLVSEEVGLDALAAAFPVAPTGERTRAVAYYDSFDWRLDAAGLRLRLVDDAFQLQSVSGCSVIASEPCLNGPNRLFAADFSSPVLRQRLQRLLGPRAALRRFVLSERVQTFDVKDAEQRVVARARLSRFEVESGAIADGILWLRQLRGHGAELEALTAALATRFATLPPALDAANLAMRALGLDPADFASKLRLDFAPDATIRQAAAAILRRLVGIIKLNLEGVAGDVDSEFLHDLRVATRKARAAASQLQAALPEGSAQTLKDELGALGAATNALRDLDVHLLSRDAYLKLLPDSLKPGWTAFVASLADQRVAEFLKLRRHLRSPAFAASLRRVDAVLETLAEGSSPPAADTARALLLSRFKKTLRRGQAVGGKAGDVELHQLRIDCKKLRYLLEFFQTLFPGKDVDCLVRQLKGLQDNLGEHNDLAVQIGCLERRLDELDAASPGAVQVAAALGAMVVILGGKLAQSRRDFHQAFGLFARDGNCELAKKLFKC